MIADILPPEVMIGDLLNVTLFPAEEAVNVDAWALMPSAWLSWFNN